MQRYKCFEDIPVFCTDLRGASSALICMQSSSHDHHVTALRANDLGSWSLYAAMRMINDHHCNPMALFGFLKAKREEMKQAHNSLQMRELKTLLIR